MQAISEVTTQKTTANQNGTIEVEPRRRKISVAEYNAMTCAGIFTTNDKIELLDGEIIEKMPKNAPHSNAVLRANYLFIKLCADKAVIRTKDVVILNDYSEPEPDLVLLKLPLEKYDFEQPTIEDVLLIMEVSDSTLGFDRNKKSRIYAQTGVMQYLILNVKSREIEDYREPSGENFRFKKTYGENERFNLVAFPEIEIKVADLLPLEKTN